MHILRAYKIVFVKLGWYMPGFVLKMFYYRKVKSVTNHIHLASQQPIVGVRLCVLG